MYLSRRKRDMEISKRKKKSCMSNRLIFHRQWGGNAPGPICPSRDRQGEG